LVEFYVCTQLITQLMSYYIVLAEVDGGHYLTSGRQGDSGRWAHKLSSAPCMSSPRCVAKSTG